MASAELPRDQEIDEVLNGVIADFDGRIGSFNEVEVVDRMRFVLGNRKLDQEDGDLYYGESNAFLFRGRIGKDDPFPGYFQPLFSSILPDGSSSWVPNPQDLTPKMTARWRNHSVVCRHPILRARYADLLWSFQKQVEGNTPNLSTARDAIQAYLEAAGLNKAECASVVIWLGRAVGLAASINDTVRQAAAIQQSFDWVEANGKPTLPGSWMFLFNDIYDNKRVSAPHKERVVSYLESVLVATTDQNQKTFDHLSAATVAELLTIHYRRQGDRNEEERVIRFAGLATEHASSIVSPLLALGWLQPQMEKYKDAGMRLDAERVQIESRRRGAASEEEMKTRSYSIPIPKEAIEKYLNWLTDPKDHTTRLRRWAVSNVNSVSQAEKNLTDSLTSTPFLARISIVKINAGQFVAKAGSIEDDLDGRLAMHLRQLTEIRFNIFVGSWKKTVDAGGIDQASLMATLSDSPAFDLEGLELIDAGILRFFREDHLAATHILIPQIERSLRTILALLGRPTNRTVPSEKGVMQERNMNEALADPAMKELLPKDFHRHLQIIFSSRLGFNLRNLIAHGILPLSEYSVLTSLMAVQGLLLLSQVKAITDNQDVGSANPA